MARCTSRSVTLKLTYAVSVTFLNSVFAVAPASYFNIVHVTFRNGLKRRRSVRVAIHVELMWVSKGSSHVLCALILAMSRRRAWSRQPRTYTSMFVHVTFKRVCSKAYIHWVLGMFYTMVGILAMSRRRAWDRRPHTDGNRRAKLVRRLSEFTRSVSKDPRCQDWQRGGA